jgi:hypothetical protein
MNLLVCIGEQGAGERAVREGGVREEDGEDLRGGVGRVCERGGGRVGGVAGGGVALVADLAVQPRGPEHRAQVRGQDEAPVPVQRRRLPDPPRLAARLLRLPGPARGELPICAPNGLAHHGKRTHHLCVCVCWKTLRHSGAF